MSEEILFYVVARPDGKMLRKIWSPDPLALAVPTSTPHLANAYKWSRFERNSANEMAKEMAATFSPEWRVATIVLRIT